MKLNALIKAISANKDKPGLFREEMVFTKAKPPADPSSPLKRPPVPAAWR